MIRPPLAALLILLGGCSLGGGGGDGDLDPNLIRKVERGVLTDEVSESGKITPRFDVDIKSKVSGEVVAVMVDEGQLVHKDDLLYTIDETEYERDVALARIALQQAKLQRENAEVDRVRKEQALASRGISEAEYDIARRDVELQRINESSAGVQLQAARDRLAWCRIVAPMEGVVIARNVEPGEVVTAGMTATVNGTAQLTIAQIDLLLLEIDLNQVDVAKVAVGQSARILLDAFPGQEVPGTVTRIAAAGHTDSARGIDVFTVKVEIDPAMAAVAIKPGMTAEVRIRIGELPDVLKLPSETVFEEDGKSYVYVVNEVDGKKAKEKVEVGVGQRTDAAVEITTGLTEGQEYYAAADVKDLSVKVD